MNTAPVIATDASQVAATLHRFTLAAVQASVCRLPCGGFVVTPVVRQCSSGGVDPTHNATDNSRAIKRETCTLR